MSELCLTILGCTVGLIGVLTGILFVLESIKEKILLVGLRMGGIDSVANHLTTLNHQAVCVSCDIESMREAIWRMSLGDKGVGCHTTVNEQPVTDHFADANDIVEKENK